MEEKKRGEEEKTRRKRKKKKKNWKKKEWRKKDEVRESLPPNSSSLFADTSPGHPGFHLSLGFVFFFFTFSRALGAPKRFFSLSIALLLCNTSYSCFFGFFEGVTDASRGGGIFFAMCFFGVSMKTQLGSISSVLLRCYGKASSYFVRWSA